MKSANSIADLFEIINWKNKVRGNPHPRKAEVLDVSGPSLVRQLCFSEKEFLPAVRFLGKLRERPGKRSVRTLWLFNDEGKDWLVVTREEIRNEGE